MARDFFNQSQSVAMQNQSNCGITFDAQLESTLCVLRNAYHDYLSAHMTLSTLLITPMSKAACEVINKESWYAVRRTHVIHEPIILRSLPPVKSHVTQ